MKQLIETVETLLVRGIGFRSLTEALDTTTAQGRLVFHMFGALAEFERSLIRERTAHRRSGLLPCTARCRDRQRIRRGARGAAPLPRPSFPICRGHWRHHR